MFFAGRFAPSQALAVYVEGGATMPARFIDAAAGYRWFRLSGGVLTRRHINAILTRTGHRPIAHTTYRHYHRLLKAGRRTYVAIRRFHVRRSQRYTARRTHSPSHRPSKRS